MTDRVSLNPPGRYARVSPSPGRGMKVAYAPCPLFDAQDVELGGNCLAIPMSSLQPPQSKSSKTPATTVAGKTSGPNGNKKGLLHVFVFLRMYIYTYVFLCW